MNARLSNLDPRTALAEATSELRTAGFTVRPLLPRPQPLQDRHLGTGDFLIDGNRPGEGVWEVENGRVVDGVVAITGVDNTTPLVAAYVEAKQALEITGVPDGNYRLYFTLGKDWDGRRFTQKCEFTVGDEPYKFETTATTATRWTTTLHPVEGGTVTVSEVDPDAFPSLAR